MDSSVLSTVAVMVDNQSKQDAGEKMQDRKPWTLKEFGGKPVWDYLDLLSKLLVPIAVAVFGGIIATAQFEGQKHIAKAQFEGQQEAELQRAQQSTLQAYFDGIQTLLLDQELRHNPDEKIDARNLARARTITALDALDRTRQRRVLRFLYETELIQARTQNRLYHPDALKEDQQPIISLKYVDLTKIDLSNRRLLSSTDLERADMNGAILRKANLSGANLTGAHLGGAKLEQADLTKTDLEKAKGITAESLHQQARSLAGATMPNGQKYEDWLKDRENDKEDAEKD